MTTNNNLISANLKINDSNVSFQAFYEKFKAKVPELAHRISFSSFDLQSPMFEDFYKNTLLQWVITVLPPPEKESDQTSNTQKTIESWIFEYFPKDHEITCLYPGGQMDLVNPFRYCDPDILVIVDPLPCGKNLDSWEEMGMAYSNKIQRVFENSEILKNKEFLTKEIELGPSGMIEWRNFQTQKIKKLYILNCKAGNELFKGSPVEEKAHLLMTRLPTFNSSVSFKALKANGLALYFTPSRDGKQLLGSIWNHFYDRESIPHILKKIGLFTDEKAIATIESLNRMVDQFYLMNIDEQDFIKTFSQVEEIIRENFGNAKETIIDFKHEWAHAFKTRIDTIKKKSALLIANELLPQECCKHFQIDVMKITQQYEKILEKIL